MSPWKLALAACAALIAFAANSLLCRAALLKAGVIDPASFTSIRLVSGAVTLAVIAVIRTGSPAVMRGSWRSAVALYLYAIFFSIAYVRLTTATGALVLFGAVQITMIGAALRGGDSLRFRQWGGVLIAFAGLLVLCAPGLRAPDPFSALLMATAGLSWGVYSLRGRGSEDPLGDTAGNFCRAVPLALVTSLVMFSSAAVTTTGVMLAVLSGAIASGIGYSIWYLVLPRIPRTFASVVQLLVPVIAATGGLLFLREPLTTRLVVAAVATLGGIGLTIVKRKPANEFQLRRGA